MESIAGRGRFRVHYNYCKLERPRRAKDGKRLPRRTPPMKLGLGRASSRSALAQDARRKAVRPEGGRTTAREAQILVIGNEGEVLAAARQALVEAGHVVEIARDGAAGIRRLGRAPAATEPRLFHLATVFELMP